MHFEVENTEVENALTGRADFCNLLSPSDEIIMNAFEIKKIRKALKWSLRKLAEETGIHHNTIYRWENGLFKPSNLAIRQMEQLKQQCIDKGLLKKGKKS